MGAASRRENCSTDLAPRPPLGGGRRGFLVPGLLLPLDALLGGLFLSQTQTSVGPNVLSQHVRDVNRARGS